ncbi:MAG: hypothetical protein GY821_07725 [Gammaproteobacteria bacterium]|nr:hypothetical protein [Gammaproteobacteria bacterium]
MNSAKSLLRAENRGSTRKVLNPYCALTSVLFLSLTAALSTLTARLLRFLFLTAALSTLTARLLRFLLLAARSYCAQ